MNMINHHNHSTHSSNYNEKMQRTQEYVDALEEERRKILVFQRELPLCLELVTQAIEACKQQLSGTTTECNFHGQSECSEQTSTEGPVLEEFIPIKRTLSSDDDEEQQSHKSKKSNISNGNDKVSKNNDTNTNEKAASSKKSDWLRSVQLWNQTPDPPKKEDSPKKLSVMEVKKNGSGGAFHPFKREKSVGANAAKEAPPKSGDRASVPVAEASSTAETGGSSGGGNAGNKMEEKEGQSQRKSRRCWSPELHKRFLLALQQLGGAHVATPKQIRELMKVDRLTNDEVKSHLQKYRLHNRRPSPSIHNSNNPQAAPQFVVVGGIWVPPPPEYAAMAASTASGEGSGGAPNSNGIYAPIPTLPPPFQDQKLRQKHNKQFHSDDDHGNHSGGGGGVPSNPSPSPSPATSSSTDTTTTSPAY